MSIISELERINKELDNAIKALEIANKCLENAIRPDQPKLRVISNEPHKR